MKTIEELRKAGFKVRVIHSRWYNPIYFGDSPALLNTKELQAYGAIAIGQSPNAKGGSTRIELRSPDGTEVFGEAHCSKVDTFNRKVGNVKALGRALGALAAIKLITV